jgi:hypothetical protein
MHRCPPATPNYVLHEGSARQLNDCRWKIKAPQIFIALRVDWRFVLPGAGRFFLPMYFTLLIPAANLFVYIYCPWGQALN